MDWMDMLAYCKHGPVIVEGHLKVVLWARNCCVRV